MTPEELVVVGTITLPGTPRSVAYARSFLRDLLPPGDPVLDDLVMVGSETVCNAVAHTASGHAGGTVTVTLAAGCGVYRLEVADEGADGARPCPRPENGAESGRGLRIVKELSLRWGFHEDGDRTIVWAEFPSPWTSGDMTGACRASRDEKSKVQSGHPDAFVTGACHS